MALYLKVILLCLLITLSLQDDPKLDRQHRVRRSDSDKDAESTKLNDLFGTFHEYLKNGLGNTAIGSKHFENKVGYKERGGSYSTVSEAGYLKGKEIITNLTHILNERLKNKRRAVERIASAVYNALNSGVKEEGYQECCNLTAKNKLTYDPRFKEKITDQIFCQFKAPDHVQKEQPDFKEVKTAFDKNYKERSLKVKWQYFGSTEGVLSNFPACSVSECDSYDNRLRPWYVTTATPSPKNIIILLDSSTSMGLENSLTAAKDSAEIVLSTLNPQDKVSVILFNASTFLPGDQNTDECYNKTLALAGLFNIKHFKSFLHRARPTGGTRFIKAFKTAIQVLKQTFDTSSPSIVARPSMILLLTNEGPKTSGVEDIVVGAVKEEFEQLRKDYNTSLRLLIMRFGSESKNKKFFNKLAKATNGILMKAKGKKDPYSKLNPYFEYLMKVTPASSTKVVFSPPYLDAFGLGYMVTAASAVQDKNKKLRGVVGVDIPMTDLVSDVQYFNRGSLMSYAFLYHSKTGDTLSHPKLPPPEAITEAQNAVNILELEQGEEFKQLFEEVQNSALKGGTQSNEKYMEGRKHAVSRGGVLGDGVKVEEVNLRYTCRSFLKVEGENEYTVCVAINENDADDKYRFNPILRDSASHAIAYHRMDVLPEAKLCYHTDTLSYADRSVVKFSAKSFFDPSLYLEEEESKSAVRRYGEQMSKELYNFELNDFQNGLRRDMSTVALLTSNLEKAMWRSVTYKNYTRKFVRRFVGTYNGVLRMFPGAPLPTNFNHLTRPWFMAAAANMDTTILTHPYLDPLGAGFVVSVSHSVKLSKKQKLFAVTGGDLTVANLGASLAKRLGKGCYNEGKLNCFLMDTSGYIVYHPSFENVYNNSTKVVEKHITQLHGDIARDLIKNGIMERRACQNYNLLKLQRFYEVTMQESSFEGKITKNSAECNTYTIAKIRQTNVFVVAVKKAACFQTATTSCPCKDICSSGENEACECPCKSRLDYNICNASMIGGRDIPVCAQPSPPVSPRAPLPDHPDDLGACLKTNCAHYKSPLDCNEIFGCVWCHKRITDGSLLKHQRCKSFRECYDGGLGRRNPFLLPFKPRKPKTHKRVFRLLGMEFTLKTLIAASSGIGVGLVLMIVTICCLCKRRNKWELDLDEMFGELDDQQPQLIDPDVVMMDFPGQSTIHMGQRLSTMQMAQRQSTIHMGQRPSTMQMAQRQSTMHMGQRRSTIHMAQRTSTMQMGQRPATMQMGQRQPAMHMAQRQPNMQMRLGAPGVQYSTQAMSGMWVQGYGQSQMMNYIPQVNTMQTPGAMATGPSGKKGRKVSFSADVPQMQAEVEPIANPGESENPNHAEDF